jgi:hypothetical protein
MQGHYIPSITSIAGPSPFALEALRGTSGGETHRLLSWGRSSQATGLRPFALPHPKRLSTSPDSPAVLAHNTLRPGSLPLRRPWPIGVGRSPIHEGVGVSFGTLALSCPYSQTSGNKRTRKLSYSFRVLWSLGKQISVGSPALSRYDSRQPALGSPTGPLPHNTFRMCSTFRQSVGR